MHIVVFIFLQHRCLYADLANIINKPNESHRLGDSRLNTEHGEITEATVETQDSSPGWKNASRRELLNDLEQKHIDLQCRSERASKKEK